MGLILNGRLTIGNIGDSIATLTNKDGTGEQLNAEHSPTRDEERLRIEAANGSVFHNRINGELSVSRAFGDYDMKNLIIAEPEGCSVPLNASHDLLILASDGLYNGYSKE